MRRIFTAASSRTVGVKNHRQVKAKLDSRGVHTMDVSTNSKNRHGEFTRITTMTYIDETNLLPLHLPEQLGLTNPRQVKARLDFGGVISSDASTSSNNQYGEFTRTQIMTIIDESNVFRCIFQRSLGKKNPIQVKASLDCAGVISMDVSTSM